MTFVAPGFEPVREVFQSFHDRGWDVGSIHSDPSVLAKILGKMPNDLDPEDPRYQLYDSEPETLREAAETADLYATDGFMLTPVAFTQGGFARLPAQDEARTETVGWGGAGGQMVRYVPELGLGCAYVTNTTGVRMAMNDPRPNALLAATIECARNASPGSITPRVRSVG